MSEQIIQQAQLKHSQIHLSAQRKLYRERYKETVYYLQKIRKFYLKQGKKNYYVQNLQKNNQTQYNTFDSSDNEGKRSQFSESSSSDDSDQLEEDINEDSKISPKERSDNFIRYHILKNHIGKLVQYQLPKPVKHYRIHNYWHSKNTYSKILRQLLLYQIIADVNRRIEEKSEQEFQKEIYIKIKTQWKFDHKKQQQVSKLIVVTQKINELYKLHQILIKGQRLGLLIKKSSLPFKVSKLFNNDNTRLCFLQYEDQQQFHTIEKKQKRITIFGIQEWQIKQEQQMTFLDLDSIVSLIRQHRAINDFPQRFISRLIVKNDIPINIHRKLQCFKQGYQQVLNQIKDKRNEDQFAIIKDLSLKKEGLYMIQGPPGTGKTQTICNFTSLQHTFLKKIKNVAQQILNYQDLRIYQKDLVSKIKTSDVIMICAQTNAAVNNIGRKLLKQKCIGKKELPNILRLGHTQEYDQQLLSINLPHLVQTQLLKGKEKQFPKSSAQLRWEKQLKYQLINKMKSEHKPEAEIQRQKKQLQNIIKSLVKIHQYTFQTNKKQYQRIQRYYLLTSQIVLSTLNTTGKRAFAAFFGPKNKKNTFVEKNNVYNLLGVYRGQKKVKCLIIDQASQATQPSTLIPMMNNVKKIILVGDHKQLQPTIMSNNWRHTKYNRSMFERLFDAGVQPKLLRYQYRMISELKDFSNHYFYESKLRDGITHFLPQFLSNVQYPSIFFDVTYGSEQKLKKSYSNESEKKCIVNLLKRLLVGKNLSIGVIAPYKSQVKDIQKSLQGQLNDSCRKRCMVSTVDAFQGQEKDIIILSCVRSNPQRMIGFVRDQKRMNVSITRARYCLFVFGNCDSLYSNELWRNYIDYHYHKGSFISIARQDKAVQIIQKYIPLQQLK